MKLVINSFHPLLTFADTRLLHCLQVFRHGAKAAKSVRVSGNTKSSAIKDLVG